MAIIRIRGVFEATGQSNFTMDFTTYATLRFLEDKTGRVINLDKVSAANAIATYLAPGQEGEFFIVASKFFSFIFGLRTNGRIVSDARFAANLKNVMLMIAIPKLLIGIPGLLVIFGIYWVFDGIKGLMIASEIPCFEDMEAMLGDPA